MVAFSADYVATSIFDFITVNCDMKDFIEETSSGLLPQSATRIYAISVWRGHFMGGGLSKIHLSFIYGRKVFKIDVCVKAASGSFTLAIRCVKKVRID